MQILTNKTQQFHCGMPKQGFTRWVGFDFFPGLTLGHTSQSIVP
jgi:hypothetical protein